MTFGRSGAASVVLNVGGARYSLSRELLKDFPLRRVSRLHGCRSERDVLEVCDDYDRERNEYFFDRHSEAFGFILLYVRGHGKLRFAPRMCELSFYNEMIYWGLEGAHLEYCCQRRLDDRMSDTYTFYTAEEPGTLGRDEARSGGAEAAPSRRWLERMRRTFEEPTSSLAAQILASVSVVFVIVSMVVLCASTLPDWRAAAADNRSLDDRSRIIEAICIGWFTAECIVRFIVSKNKCEFVKRPLNIIDLLAITPYYISVLMTVFTGENSQLQRAGVTLRVLRMMRIFWVIKLARHFIGLQTLGLTLKRCYREMVMLLVFICVAMAIFSALSQLLEHGLDLETSNKDFASIPAACWIQDEGMFIAWDVSLLVIEEKEKMVDTHRLSQLLLDSCIQERPHEQTAGGELAPDPTVRAPCSPISSLQNAILGHLMSRHQRAGSSVLQGPTPSRGKFWSSDISYWK